MKKLMKGIDQFSPDDIRKISIFLESLTGYNISKIYLKSYRHFFLKIFGRTKEEIPHQSLKKVDILVDYLNNQYNAWEAKTNEKSLKDFKDLLKEKLNVSDVSLLYYEMLDNASKAYLISKDATPSRKADLITNHVYNNLIENLKKIMQTLSEVETKAIENELDGLLMEMTERENLILSEKLKIKNLSGQKILKKLTKVELLKPSTFSVTPIPKPIIKTTNAIIKKLCDEENQVFTAVKRMGRTFLFFNLNKKLYWIVEVTPLKIVLNDKIIGQEIYALIIFLSKIVNDENYLPSNSALPGFHWKDKEKNAYMRRNMALYQLKHKLENNMSNINEQTKEYYLLIEESKQLVDDLKELKGKEQLNKSERMGLENDLGVLKEKTEQLEFKYNQLALKKTTATRVKEKLKALEITIENNHRKIADLEEKIASLVRFYEKIKDTMYKNSKRLEVIASKNTRSKMSLELLKKETKAYSSKIFQLRELNYFSLSKLWRNSFTNLRFKKDIVEELLIFDLESLLCVERVLFELNNSTVPQMVGKRTKRRRTLYLVKVFKEKQVIFEIYYQVKKDEVVLVNIENKNELISR